MTQTTHELPAQGGLPDAGNPALRRYTQSYQYDGVGNLLEMKHQLGSGGSVLWKRDYAYASGSNRLLTTSMGQSSLSYDYDARGALSNLPHLQGFTRDFRDQLRKVVLDLAGNEAWYAHDGAGQRVRKFVDKGAVTEERIYVGGWEVWRKRVNGTLDEERTTLHVRDGQRRVAMVETKTVAGGQAVGSPVARWRFQLDDHLGSAVSECDEEGGVFSYEELHPYGSVAWSAVDSALDVSTRRYRYTGMERDEETGLQAHGVRMYAPWLGRWDRPDPIGLGDGVNRWGYCHQAPSRGRDASGLADDEPGTPVAASPPEDQEWAPEERAAAAARIRSVLAHPNTRLITDQSKHVEFAVEELSLLADLLESTDVRIFTSDTLGPTQGGTTVLAADGIAEIRIARRVVEGAGDVGNNELDWTLMHEAAHAAQFLLAPESWAGLQRYGVLKERVEESRARAQGSAVERSTSAHIADTLSRDEIVEVLEVLRTTLAQEDSAHVVEAMYRNLSRPTGPTHPQWNPARAATEAELLLRLAIRQRATRRSSAVEAQLNIAVFEDALR